MDMRLESISIPSPDPQVKATGGGMNMFPRRGSGMNGGIVPNTMVIDTIVRDSTTSQIILWTVGWDRLGNSLLAIKLCHELRNLSHEGANLLFQLSIFSSHGLKGPRGFIVICA